MRSSAPRTDRRERVDVVAVRPRRRARAGSRCGSAGRAPRTARGRTRTRPGTRRRRRRPSCRRRAPRRAACRRRRAATRPTTERRSRRRSAGSPRFQRGRSEKPAAARGHRRGSRRTRRRRRCRRPRAAAARWTTGSKLGFGPATTRNATKHATITTVLPIGAAAVIANRRRAYSTAGRDRAERVEQHLRQEEPQQERRECRCSAATCVVLGAGRSAAAPATVRRRCRGR